MIELELPTAIEPAPGATGYECTFRKPGVPAAFCDYFPGANPYI